VFDLFNKKTSDIVRREDVQALIDQKGVVGAWPGLVVAEKSWTWDAFIFYQAQHIEEQIRRMP
jgi:hypothetical protein